MSRNKRNREAPIFSNVILGTLVFFLGTFSYGVWRLGDVSILLWSASATIACIIVLALINTNHSFEEDD